jgi:DNA-binding HxlR family transcriptional regulator
MGGVAMHANGGDESAVEDPLNRAAAILGERWTLLILYQVSLGVHRFGELQRALGISRNILALRLRQLLKHGILKRARYRADPARYEYHLTKRGRALLPVFAEIIHWSDVQLADARGAGRAVKQRR